VASTRNAGRTQPRRSDVRTPDREATTLFNSAIVEPGGEVDEQYERCVSLCGVRVSAPSATRLLSEDGFRQVRACVVGNLGDAEDTLAFTEPFEGQLAVLDR
jgi:hypothetical protein